VAQPKNDLFVANTVRYNNDAIVICWGMFQLTSVPVLSVFEISRSINTKWASFGLCLYCTRLLRVNPLKTRDRERRTKKNRRSGKNGEVRQFRLEGKEHNSF
jgi:hypothetical protein